MGYISRLATRGRGRQNLADPGSKTPTAPTKPSETQTERIARRFYCALVLHDLIQEVASSSISPYQNSLYSITSFAETSDDMLRYVFWQSSDAAIIIVRVGNEL